MQPRRMLQLLASASPGIPRCPHRNSSRPPIFLGVRATISNNVGVGVIPSALRSIISEYHSEDTLTTPDYAYGDGSTATQRYRSSRLWETVLDLWTEADCCANPTDDENAWSRLVDRILRVSVSGSELLKVRSLQTQSFHEYLLPALPSGMTVNRKVDYCLTSSIDNPDFGPVYDVFSSGASTLTLGLTNDAVAENLPILFGVEIKKINGDVDDAEVQLKIFFHAFFKRLEYIETYLERKVDMAVMGVVVHGHTWIPYVACREGTELHVERLAHAICHTESFLGVFTTISLLDRIQTYIENVLWPVYHNQIIIPLANKLIHSPAPDPITGQAPMPLKTIHKELLARVVASGAMLGRSERSADEDIERDGHFIQENKMALQEHAAASNDEYTSTVYMSDVGANAPKRQPHTHTPLVDSLGPS